MARHYAVTQWRGIMPSPDTAVRIVSQTATRGHLYSLCHGGNVVDKKV
jgi:hypothetical protein